MSGEEPVVIGILAGLGIGVTTAVVIVIVVFAVLLVFVAICAVPGSCDTEDDDDGCGGDDDTEGDQDDWQDDEDDEDVAGVDGLAWSGSTLHLESTNLAKIRIVQDGPSLDATLRIDDGAGDEFIEPHRTITGHGEVLDFPEASLFVYTAVFDVPSRAASPCGNSPMRLAMSLGRQGDRDDVVGGIAVYCGGNEQVDPVRIMRLEGPFS